MVVLNERIEYVLGMATPLLVALTILVGFENVAGQLLMLIAYGCSAVIFLNNRMFWLAVLLVLGMLVTVTYMLNS